MHVRHVSNARYTLLGRWKGMVPDVMVLCMVVMFGVSVSQRVYHIAGHDTGSLLQSIYERTGLLLDITILVLQVACKHLTNFS